MRLAVANFYVFPLRRLTLSYSARTGRLGLPVLPIPEFPLKLVRSVEITGNFRRCKKNFVKFCAAGAFQGTGKEL